MPPDAALVTLPRNRTLPALGALVLIWGGNFSLVKFALRDVAPLPFTTLRFLLASALLWAFLRATGERVRIAPAHWRRVVGLGLVGTSLYQTLFIFGIDWTLAGNASLMLAAGPVFTTMLSVAFRHERLGVTAVGGVLLSVAGIALVVLGGPTGVRFGAATWKGDLVVLTAASAWSFYTVGSAPLVQRYGVLPVTAATMWVGTTGLVTVSLPAFLAQPWRAIRLSAWLAVLYSGAFAIATAYFLWYYCVSRIGSTRTAVYTNAVPIVALLIAWLTLREAPTSLQAGGAAAIIAGSLLVHLGKIERAHTPRHPR